MTEKDALKIAVPVVKNVVDCIAEKNYEHMFDYAELSAGNRNDLINAIIQFMDDAELTFIDPFDTPCKYVSEVHYDQLDVFIYSDGRGFAIDYFLTTDGEENDLTLQMEFLIDENGNYSAFIEDCHVL